MSWMLYLRFDTDNETRNALVFCGNKAEVREVLDVAKQLFAGALTEYASFYSGRGIRTMEAPNFPEELIFSSTSFLKACGVKPGQKDWQQQPRPAHPPGSPRQALAKKPAGLLTSSNGG